MIPGLSPWVNRKHPPWAVWMGRVLIGYGVVLMDAHEDRPCDSPHHETGYPPAPAGSPRSVPHRASVPAAPAGAAGSVAVTPCVRGRGSTAGRATPGSSSVSIVSAPTFVRNRSIASSRSSRGRAFRLAAPASRKASRQPLRSAAVTSSSRATIPAVQRGNRRLQPAVARLNLRFVEVV